METEIFTCKYFKFGRNTTGLSQSHLRNFLACSITVSNYYFLLQKVVSRFLQLLNVVVKLLQLHFFKKSGEVFFMIRQLIKFIVSKM